jgi:hypothetical protein
MLFQRLGDSRPASVGKPVHAPVLEVLTMTAVLLVRA